MGYLTWRPPVDCPWKNSHLCNTKGWEPESESLVTKQPATKRRSNWMKQLSNIWFTRISLRFLGRLNNSIPTIRIPTISTFAKKTGWWIPARTIWSMKASWTRKCSLLWDEDISFPSSTFTPKKNHANLLARFQLWECHCSTRYTRSIWPFV